MSQLSQLPVRTQTTEEFVWDEYRFLIDRHTRDSVVRVVINGRTIPIPNMLYIEPEFRTAAVASFVLATMDEDYQHPPDGHPKEWYSEQLYDY
ncbi:hypothetical protein AKO1_003359 [Acrasis kona]|uniref:Uncharacterized protein n=1 Tax=Acrasis kona TaxID=1008807 RepID=A0AAW2Z8R8_9EUKA